MWYKIRKRILFALQFTLGGYQEIIDNITTASGHYDFTTMAHLIQTAPDEFKQDETFWIKMLEQVSAIGRGRRNTDGITVVLKLMPQKPMSSLLRCQVPYKIKGQTSAERILSFIEECEQSNELPLLNILLTDISLLTKIAPHLDLETKQLIFTVFNFGAPEAFYLIEKCREYLPDIHPLDIAEDKGLIGNKRINIIYSSLFQEISQPDFNQSLFLVRGDAISFILEKENIENYKTPRLRRSILRFIQTSLLCRYVLKNTSILTTIKDKLEKLDQKVVPLLYISLTCITNKNYKRLFLDCFGESLATKCEKELEKFKAALTCEELEEEVAKMQHIYKPTQEEASPK